MGSHFQPSELSKRIPYLAKHYLKGSEKEAKAFTKLVQQEFSCPSDAKRQLDKFAKKI
jgi:hypothetical protein